MIVISNKTYNVPIPSGMRSFALQQKLLPVAGRVANVFVQLVGNVKDVADIAGADVIRVLPLAMPHVGEIFSQMPDGQLESIVRTLLGDPKTGAIESATCDKLPLFSAGSDAFDALMRGKTVDTWKLVLHALEVWYPDFFGAVRGYLGPTAAKASPSPGSDTSSTPGPVSA